MRAQKIFSNELAYPDQQVLSFSISYTLVTQM
jgi:hypothetical protein